MEAEFDSVTGEFEINANAVNGFPYIPGDDAAGTEASVINEPILSNIAFYKTGQDFVPLNGNTYPVRFKVERKAAGEPEESFEDWSAGPDGSSMIPVSYTHLDVYKRQYRGQPGQRKQTFLHSG